MRYDIAIVGSGPAGISAAINAKIRNKNIIVFGNENLSNKLVKAPSIDNYLGFYEISGEDLKDKAVSIPKAVASYIKLDQKEALELYRLLYKILRKIND